jgi:hypothetical protein
LPFGVIVSVNAWCFPGLLAEEETPDDTLGNAQHIWNIKPENLEKLFLVLLSLLPLQVLYLIPSFR